VADSQRLTELRDALLCPADLNLRALGMAVPSAYFYIEGTFYNDLRSPGSLDYSQPIIRFCQENSLPPPLAPQRESAEASAMLRDDDEDTGDAYYAVGIPPSCLQSYAMLDQLTVGTWASPEEAQAWLRDALVGSDF
jgi:hypothetical protein